MLKPERIAFYSYAHLPSSFPAQKSFEAYLPKEKEKRLLYEFGKNRLIQMGYEEIGMDHFALPDDPLCLAKKEGKLHRNFMGYTTQNTKMLLGLGASSISDVWLGYAQNEKSVEGYQRSIQDGTLPLIKGHENSQEDLEVRQLILELICQGKAAIPFDIWEKLPLQNLENLHEMENEGLLQSNQLSLKVTDEGMAIVRNVCSQFDLRMIANAELKASFSQAI